MLSIRRLLGCLAFSAADGVLLFRVSHNRPVQAYVEAPHSLGQVISLSTQHHGDARRASR